LSRVFLRIVRLSHYRDPVTSSKNLLRMNEVVEQSPYETYSFVTLW
jgi:hypothetical protein